MKKMGRENSKPSPASQNGRNNGQQTHRMIRGKEEANEPRKLKE